ncbi:MAG: class I SAM-dependent methyltransferase [Thermoguttaceae bacterium]|jgi:SAM-dependent methyltransferase
MERVRKPFQGVWNIVRFNWHFYLLSLGLSLILLLLNRVLDEPYRCCAIVAGLLLIGTTLITLLVSFYVYDLPGLYQMKWSGDCAARACIVNIHAGFDETSVLLKERFPGSELSVFDFYDPAKHTEVSIKRARKACPPCPGTRSIKTSHIPLPDDSADKIFVTLSAHEIRNDDERIAFFAELKRSLKPTGQIVVTEHLRDLPNFLAYNIGFFHFLPVASWNKTFHHACLSVTEEIKTTPFITTFILEKHGSAT